MGALPRLRPELAQVDRGLRHIGRGAHARSHGMAIRVLLLVGSAQLVPAWAADGVSLSMSRQLTSWQAAAVTTPAADPSPRVGSTPAKAPTPAVPGGSAPARPGAVPFVGASSKASSGRLGGPAGARTLGCLIEPHRVVEVGAPVVGVLEHVHVERGDVVRAGQPLATLRADVERAAVAAAATRAEIDAEVRAALAAGALADQKLKRTQQLVAQEFMSPQALEQARAEADVASEKVQQARSQQAVWRRERDVAAAQLGLRTVRSPLDGIVTERYAQPGERVEERPLLRVAVIDPLRVELMLPTEHYRRVSLGQVIVVHPELPGAEPVGAEVVRIDPVLDPASNTFRVRLRLSNAGGKLPAGLRCWAEVAGDGKPPLSVQAAR